MYNNTQYDELSEVCEEVERHVFRSRVLFSHFFIYVRSLLLSMLLKIVLLGWLFTSSF